MRASTEAISIEAAAPPKSRAFGKTACRSQGSDLWASPSKAQCSGTRKICYYALSPNAEAPEFLMAPSRKAYVG